MFNNTYLDKLYSKFTTYPLKYPSYSYERLNPQPFVKSKTKPKYKPKTYRRYKKRSYPKPITAKVNRMAKQVRSLQQKSNQDTALHIDRKRYTYRQLCPTANNTSQLASYDLNTIAYMEDTLTGLRYYDPSSPSSLVNASGLTGGFSKQFLFKRITAKMIIRNNYAVPVNVTAYIVTPKGITDITAYNAFANGLADVGNPGSTSNLVFPTDSDQFSDLWKIQSSKAVRLTAGRELKMRFSVPKGLTYDPSTVDSEAGAYSNIYKSAQLLLRVEGVLGHDATLDEQGSIKGGVDIQISITHYVNYDAGAKIKYVRVADYSDSFTATYGVVSTPDVENINFIVS